MTRRTLFLAGLALVLSAVILSVSLGISDRQPIINGEGFLERSRLALTDIRFYTSIRPFTTDLFFKVFGSSPGQVVFGQMIVNAVAWPFLGFCVACFLRRNILAVAALVLLGSLGLWWNVLAWTLVMRSESANFSFFALWLGCLVLFIGSGRRAMLAVLVPVMLLFSFTRDNIPYLLVGVTLVLLPLLALAERRWLRGHAAGMVMFAIAVAAIFTLQSLSAQATVSRHDDIVPGRTLEFRSRFEFNLINVIFKRILPDPAAYEWFVGRGMPSVDTAMWSGAWASSHDWALYTDDRYVPLRTYVQGPMRGDFAVFLLTHPRYALMQPLQRDSAELWPFDMDGYAYPAERTGQRTILLVSRVWSRVVGQASLLLAGLGILVLGLVVRRPVPEEPAPTCSARRRMLLLSIALLCGMLGQIALIYHVDAMEVSRHLLLVPLGTLATLVLAVLFVLDGLTSGTWAGLSRRFGQRRMA